MRLSGERFAVKYRLQGESREEAHARARDICLEQTVEFPEELVPAGFIRDEIVGRVEWLEETGRKTYLAEISFAVETAADELTQLLNVIYGNISIKPGIRVESLRLPPALSEKLRGPRFGRDGLRSLLNVPRRPLLHTALKPMGLTAGELADVAYRCALGGIDIVKDDHGLTNQCSAPFAERVGRCAEAVGKANRLTGASSIYVANITAAPAEMVNRAQIAKAAGAGGFLVSPALAGLGAMGQIAGDDSLGLPVISHPAFQGSYCINPASGISHYAYYGQITRLAGADAVVYPNFGGRFSFSREECAGIAAGTMADMGGIKAIFPSPGGGMSLEKVPEMLAVYGREVIFLIGGGLFRHGPDLLQNCRHFRAMVEQYE
ncbi:MAG TPA: RuBisCO large subunit C-terminal-like domain-containing protein [Selenomonadales bacterium]|nr:RuBisCO large subunit C-terminal-like domain-containing protein [Selenomonadales bacterium]